MRAIKPIVVCVVLGGLWSATAFADPPASSGVVQRFENDFAVFVSDTKSDLTLVWGWDIREPCRGNFEADEAVYQLVDLPTAADREIYIIQGQGQVWVWPFSLEEFDCTPFLTTEPIGNGMGTVQFTESFSLTPSQPPTVSRFGFTVKGTIYDEVGNPGDVRGTAQILIFEGVDVREAISKVRLRMK